MSEAVPWNVDYLDYRMRGAAAGSHPGKHAARHSGAGGDFQAYRPFWQLPDARRIDIRRSIIDPFGAVMVRQTQQRSSIHVVLAVDLSQSMRPAEDRSCMQAVRTLAQSCARSAARAGDAFGLITFDRTVRDGGVLAPSRGRGTPRRAAELLQRLQPSGNSAAGMQQLVTQLPANRCLLLLASDFLLPFAELEAALVSLARHDVVPIVLPVDRAYTLPRAGLLRLRDVETGRARLLLLRRSVHRRWQREEAARQDRLDQLFRRHARPAFHATYPLDVARLSEHLCGS